jgi:hypothetical protein
MQNDNILYIPIQINGGDTVDGKALLERELFIDKDKVVYVGPDHDVIVGRVIPEAVIDSPTIKNKLIIGDELIVEDTTNINNPEHGQVVFIKNK